jgi:hypothetical protein
LSFDLVSHLSGLNLVRGLPKLKFEKNLVCAPCRHGKMVATPHPPLTDVMTERPAELLHMDLVGPARVRSVGGKWYVLGGQKRDIWFCSRSDREVEEREAWECYSSYPQ